MVRHVLSVALVYLAACASAPKPEDPAKLTAGTIGVQIGSSGASNVIVIQRLVVDGPAAAAGITAGELVWTIDGASTIGMSLDDAAQMLRGRVGSLVAVHVGANEEEARLLKIKRAEIVLDELKCLAGDCQGGSGQSVDRWGDRYDGQYTGGRYEGQGKLTATDGTVYEGAFSGGLANGSGVAVMSNGARIEGTFDMGYPIGTTKVTLTNGDVYEGDMRGWEMHGQGKMTRPSNGDVWSGSYEAGRLVEGSWLHYPEGGDGRTCVRAVRGGELEKSGTINYPPKDKKKRVLFQGAFGDDCLANGEGLMTYEKKKVEGTFENDEPKKGATKNVK